MISCRDCALRLIAFKDRTEKEITDKLFQKGYTAEQIEAETEFLRAYGYIDDTRYAKRYAHDCAAIKKWGAQRIAGELVRRGIDRTAALAAAEAAASENDGVLHEEMKKRFAAADFKNPRERGKIFAYFARRGFSAEKIRGAINDMCSFEDICFDEDFEEGYDGWQ